MAYKLMAIDIDGTLLNHKGKISSANKTAVKKLVDQGTKIVLCTGRPFKEAIEYAKELGLDKTQEYLIDYGGSMIQDYNGKVIYQQTMRNHDCTEISQFLFAHKIAFKMIDTQGNLYDSDQEWTERRMLQPDLAVLKFLMTTHKHKLIKWSELLHTTYDQKFFVVETSPKEVEICPKDTNKGTGLEHLIKYLKLEPKHVVAIGDMDNDLPMLKLAGLSIAMGNANDNVKEICDQETSDNDHDGLAHAIEQYLLK